MEVYIPNSKELYCELEENKGEIEQQTGLQFEWNELPQKQASRIIVKCKPFNLKETEEWNSHHKWMLETIEKIRPVFVKYIQQWQ